MFKTDLPGDRFEMPVLSCRSLMLVIIDGETGIFYKVSKIMTSLANPFHEALPFTIHKHACLY